MFTLWICFRLSRVLALIKKFRLGFHDVEVLPDIHRSPQPEKYSHINSFNKCPFLFPEP